MEHNLNLYDKVVAEILERLLSDSHVFHDRDGQELHKNPLICCIRSIPEHFMLILLAGTANSFLPDSHEWYLDVGLVQYLWIKFKYRQATGSSKFPLKRLKRHSGDEQNRRYSAQHLLSSPTAVMNQIKLINIFKEYYAKR